MLHLIMHCEDHHLNRCMVFCEVLYFAMLDGTFRNSTIFRELAAPIHDVQAQIQKSIRQRFRATYEWACRSDGKPAQGYILAKRKKQWATKRPIVSFAGGFFRPMLEAVAQVIHSVLETVRPQAVAKGDVFTLLSLVQKFFLFSANRATSCAQPGSQRVLHQCSTRKICGSMAHRLEKVSRQEPPCFSHSLFGFCQRTRSKPPSLERQEKTKSQPGAIH